jgi:enoyl-CoA hydratase/carnithine racemase
MRDYHGMALSWAVRDGIVEVKLHHGACNEIGTTMLRELEQLAAFVEGGAAGASAMILYSDRDRGFCAGADLRELYEGMRSIGSTRSLRKLARNLLGGGSTLGDLAARGRRALTTPLLQREVRRFLHRIHHVFDTLDTAPLTTIAAVHGVVFGGGLELALTADLIIADRSARFAFPELRLGLVPGFGGIPRLERDLGNAVVRDLLLTGRSLNARRAHELGLVSQSVGRGDHLAAARAAAKQATRFDRATMRTAKAFAKKLPRARLDEEIETFLSLVSSPTVESALERFVQSTDPRPYLP